MGKIVAHPNLMGFIPIAWLSEKDQATLVDQVMSVGLPTIYSVRCLTAKPTPNPRKSK